MLDVAPVSSKELLDIQATTDCRLTLKQVCDMTRTHSQELSYRSSLFYQIILFKAEFWGIFRLYIMEHYQSHVAEIGSKWFLFIRSKKVPCLSSYLLPIHKKNNVYPTHSQYYTWLLKKYFCLHLSQS